MSRRRPFLVAAAVGALLAALPAARAGDTFPPVWATVKPHRLPYVWLRNFTDIGEYERRTYVARTAAEWRAIWNAGGRRPGTAPPVDFRRRMVVGISDVVPDSCHGVRIASARVGRDGAAVQWRRTVLSGPYACLDAVFRVTVFATIPRTGGPVRFEELPLLTVTR